jgi:Protein of unknown function (DUF4199)
MKRTVLTFGLISGAISAATMLATIPFVDKIGWEKGEILGYTTIVLSALMVFFGVRSYRENVAGGRLTFGRGFAIGILITLNLQRVLRGYLGNRLLQTDARLCR